MGQTVWLVAVLKPGWRGTNGHAAYEDTIPGPGHFEYEVVGRNDSGDGAASNVVLVLAD